MLGKRNTDVEALEIRHLEFRLSFFAQLHEVANLWFVVQFRFDPVISSKPEAVISKDSRSSYGVIDFLHALTNTK